MCGASFWPEVDLNALNLTAKQQKVLGPAIKTMREKERQRKTIVLIASENFTSKAVMDVVGSVRNGSVTPRAAALFG